MFSLLYTTLAPPRIISDTYINNVNVPQPCSFVIVTGIAHHNAFLSHLATTFDDKHDTEDAKQKLFSFRQGNRTIKEFNALFNALCYDVNLNDETRCDVYEKALNPKILQFAVVRGDWKSATTLKPKQLVAVSAAEAQEKLNVIGSGSLPSIHFRPQIQPPPSFDPSSWLFVERSMSVNDVLALTTQSIVQFVAVFTLTPSTWSWIRRLKYKRNGFQKEALAEVAQAKKAKPSSSAFYAAQENGMDIDKQNSKNNIFAGGSPLSLFTPKPNLSINLLLLDTLPPELSDFNSIFLNEGLNSLPPHRENFDCEINLKPNSVPPFTGMYNLSEKENRQLKEYVDKNLKKDFIQESSSPAAKYLTPQQARWAAFLDGFNFVILHISWKSNPADGPSRRPDFLEGQTIILQSKSITDKFITTNNSINDIEPTSAIEDPIQQDLYFQQPSTELIKFLTEEYKKLVNEEKESLLESNGLLWYKNRVYVPQACQGS
ncbi:hypothetical protein MJO28_014565 [Puccinia striiformis f. sp. tritici]|uniref:Uncharacterized protein n=1 Tax=Puccinia striiformis f. sp. tritici TaxID=168172 RepID=A0ACC0DUI0_9BASI|nr:hypothetical protein MJO28_014565 [Puccinia striiformis f. sp. tritici]